MGWPRRMRSAVPRSPGLPSSRCVAAVLQKEYSSAQLPAGPGSKSQCPGKLPTGAGRPSAQPYSWSRRWLTAQWQLPGLSMRHRSLSSGIILLAPDVTPAGLSGSVRFDGVFDNLVMTIVGNDVDGTIDTDFTT